MNYDIDQIKTLEFKEAIRTKVAMYAGSADNNGAFQVFKEILGNSIDEFMNNYGNKINVNYYEDGKISVQDFGRGIPFSKDINDTTFKDVFVSPHTSGKFDHKAYKNSVGLHGIGLKLAALSSKTFKALSYRNSLVATLILEKGEIISYDVGFNTTKIKHGTYIEYQLDPVVFHVEPLKNDSKFIIDFCRLCSFLNAGLEIAVNDKKEKKTYKFKSKGIIDLINEDYSHQLVSPIIGHAQDETDEVEICYTWVNDSKEKFYLFVNGMEITNGGQPISGFRTGITRTINNLTKNKFKGDNIRRGIVYIINIKCLNPSFSDQRKSQINNVNLRTLTDRAISDSLKDFYYKAPAKFNSMIELFNKTEKAEQAAERARNAVLNANKEIVTRSNKKVFASDKLKDAETLGQEATLIICEGDSALGALAQARDTKKYGLLALRGKIINSLTNDLDKVLENEEVRLILSALGVSVNNYSAKKLRYGRVAIASDQDSDGNHIFLLVLTLFRELVPQFLHEGRLYRLESPLYVISSGKKHLYYYSADEVAKYKGSGARTLIKGLGEMSSTQMKESMFGNSQRLTQIKWNDDISYLLFDFMGKDVVPRKEYLFKYADFNTIQE